MCQKEVEFLAGRGRWVLKKEGSKGFERLCKGFRRVRNPIPLVIL
jgi:hypothetical protein